MSVIKKPLKNTDLLISQLLLEIAKNKVEIEELKQKLEGGNKDA